LLTFNETRLLQYSELQSLRIALLVIGLFSKLSVLTYSLKNSDLEKILRLWWLKNF
jgi:hypothetical protein